MTVSRSDLPIMCSSDSYVSGSQTISKWVNENVYQRFYSILNARSYIPGYEDAPIGFDFTGSDINPALRTEIMTPTGT